MELDLFDKYSARARELLSSAVPAALRADPWPASDKAPFLMERDTAIELGGYPKQSVNLFLCSSNAGFRGESGVYLLGPSRALAGGGGHISYGKVVFLQVGELEEDQLYDFLQSVQMADIRLKFRDVMRRTSSQQFHINLRVGKQAMADGFSLERMGRTMLEHFLRVPHVRRAEIVLIVGDSPVYRELLPMAENVKRIGAALNTMFDGIDMDCGHCSFNVVCAEVEGLRALHKAAVRQEGHN